MFEFVKLHEDAVIPLYQTTGSAGLDLSSVESTTIPVGGRKLVKTGLAFNSFPVNYEAQVRPRSGLALKHGVTVLNSPGTIDSDYRGEIGVILYNAGDSIFSIQKGDRIAQLVFSPVYQHPDLVLDNNRGDGGFGSTNV